MREYVGEVMAHFWAERSEAYAAGATPPLGAPAPCSAIWVSPTASQRSRRLPHWITAAEPNCPCLTLLQPRSSLQQSADQDGFLTIERRRPPCGDPQHILNKLLFDALNEALAAHYVQARRLLAATGLLAGESLAVRHWLCEGCGPHTASHRLPLKPQALNSYAGRLDPRLALLSPELLERHVVRRVLRWAALGDAGGGGTAAVGGGGDLGALLTEDAQEVRGRRGSL